MSGHLFRTAFAEEIPEVLKWAAAEGWNPGLADAAAFHAADPEGFFVAEKEGRPVAAISVVNHSDSFAFLGLYICKPAHRGSGIGFGLWEYALKHAGSRTVGLDGVADQQANYARSGFSRTGATTRYEGQLQPKVSTSVRLMQPGDAESVAALDAQANGYERARFLSAWCAPVEHRQSMVLERGDQVEGMVTARRCRDGVKLGPILAPEAESALELAAAALAVMPGEKTIIDLPAQSVDLANALGNLGFEPGFATARMYRGPAPVTGPELQAIATMELG